MPVELNQAKSLFLAMLEMPAHERAAFLETHGGADAGLRQRVEAMLQADEASGELLPRPAGQMLAGDAATAAFSQAASAESANEVTCHDDDVLACLSSSSRSGSLGRLGHYEIQEVVGQGGFGTVFRAFDEKLHRIVAIKVLAANLATNGTARTRFAREAKTVAAVVHEHVITIHAVEDDAKPPYIVMQFVDGLSLQEKLDREGPLELKEILRIGMQVAEGLSAAHKQGLVHRDIKPANILLENGVQRVKITDFGLAKVADDASVSQSGVIAGTPLYMSPEQAEGLTIDHRSDLFSLGTVLYAMCTGRPPFRASGTMAVLKRVVEETPRSIRESNPEIPEWLCNLIAKLHAKKPDERFQTAKEVAELLGQCLADVQAGRTASVNEPRPAALVHASGSPPKSRSRRRVAALLALVPFLALIAFGIWWFSRTPKPPNVPPDANPDVVILNGDGPTDLIPFARPELSHERWEVRNGTLVHPAQSKATAAPMLPLAVRGPDEYDLEAEFERASGSDFVGFGMSAYGRRFEVALDTWGRWAGVQEVSGEGLNKNPTRRKGPWITAGIRYHFRCEVRASGIRAWLDGWEVADYRGGYEKLTVVSALLPEWTQFFVQANDDCEVVIYKLVLTPRSTTTAPATPFVVLPKDATADRKFATLAEAVAAAMSGDTIEIRGDGPFVSEPLSLGNKALRIRAAVDSRPVLLLAPPHEQMGEEFLATDAPLVLEGLEFRRVGREDRQRLPYAGNYHLTVRRAALWVANCRFVMKTTGIEYQPIPLNLVECEHVEIVNSEFYCYDYALALNFAPEGRFVLRNNLFAGPNAAINIPVGKQPFAFKAGLNCQANTFLVSGRVFRVHDFKKPDEDSSPPVTIDWRQNVVRGIPLQHRIYGPGNSAPPEDYFRRLKRIVQFREEQNLYFRPPLFQEGEDSTVLVRNLESWDRLFGLDKTRSVVTDPSPQLAKLLERIQADPTTLTSADFRLDDSSPGKRAGPGGKDLGADADLVGPGAAYEKWKQTPEYQEWRKKTDELMATGVDDAWVKQVAAMPAEQQVDAVAAKLKELNPGFDGKFTHKIEDGVVTELRIVTDKVTNISPIQVFNGLRVLDCGGTMTPDFQTKGQLADLTPLEGMNLSGLMELSLYWTKVSDEGLAHCKSCKNLTILRLDKTRVSDAGLAHFKDCKNLAWLRLHGTHVSGAGLVHFKDCKNLALLDLSYTQVGNEGLAHFRECKNLTQLFLYSTKVSDAGLVHFKDCKGLTWLSLDGTHVSDQGLAYFKDCKDLAIVGLSDTQVGDEGVAHFKDCKNLMNLNLRKTNVTAAKVAEWKKALPDCKIEWDEK